LSRWRTAARTIVVREGIGKRNAAMVKAAFRALTPFYFVEYYPAK
jgi:hypothetical protein